MTYRPKTPGCPRPPIWQQVLTASAFFAAMTGIGVSLLWALNIVVGSLLRAVGAS